MKRWDIWVAVADYGLNGAQCLGVFDHTPTETELESLDVPPPSNPKVKPSMCSGFGGIVATGHFIEISHEHEEHVARVYWHPHASPCYWIDTTDE